MDEHFPLQSSLVFAARGNRDYVHSIDMICAAPILPNTTSFRFRFHSIVGSPGRWIGRDITTDGVSTKAELSINDAIGSRSYNFICPDEDAALHPIADFPFQFDQAGFRLEEGTLSGPLKVGFQFWEQLTEAVRYGGELLFPGRKWLTCGLSGTPACLEPVPRGATIRLHVISSRSRLNIIGYATDYGAKGRIMTTPA